MIIKNGTHADLQYIDQKLIEFNSQKVSLETEKVFEEIFKCVKNSKNDIVGGISGDIELKCALHIKLFWIHECCRSNGLGKQLLNTLELESIQKGAKFSYLETFNFQAREFYEHNGYKVFSQLKYPDGNIIYFMKRIF